MHFRNIDGFGAESRHFISPVRSPSGEAWFGDGAVLPAGEDTGPDFDSPFLHGFGLPAQEFFRTENGGRGSIADGGAHTPGHGITYLIVFQYLFHGNFKTVLGVGIEGAVVMVFRGADGDLALRGAPISTCASRPEWHRCP
jgi:hypothetical protein